jgi:GxxExxY protein
MPEFAADNAVLVEIKIAPQYDKRDEAQLLNVLKATGLTIGILLNFGRYKSRTQTAHLLNLCFICGWNND